jgi:hypothetical protein
VLICNIISHNGIKTSDLERKAVIVQRDTACNTDSENLILAHILRNLFIDPDE